MAETIGNMTKEELQAMIEQIIDRKFKNLLGNEPDTRSIDEVLDSIKRNRWTPPPGSPSNAELIREDRE